MDTTDTQEKAKIMRREGKILRRQDSLTEQGFKSVIWVEYEGSQYTIQMLNGAVECIKDFKQHKHQSNGKGDGEGVRVRQLGGNVTT